MIGLEIQVKPTLFLQQHGLEDQGWPSIKDSLLQECHHRAERFFEVCKDQQSAISQSLQDHISVLEICKVVLSLRMENVRPILMFRPLIAESFFTRKAFCGTFSLPIEESGDAIKQLQKLQNLRNQFVLDVLMVDEQQGWQVASLLDLTNNDRAEKDDDNKQMLLCELIRVNLEQFNDQKARSLISRLKPSLLPTLALMLSNVARARMQIFLQKAKDGSEETVISFSASEWSVINSVLSPTLTKWIMSAPLLPTSPSSMGSGGTTEKCDSLTSLSQLLELIEDLSDIKKFPDSEISSQPSTLDDYRKRIAEMGNVLRILSTTSSSF